MPNTLKLNPIIANDDYAYWLNKSKVNNLPFEYTKAYFYILNRLIAHYKEIIEEIIEVNGGNIEFPMETDYIENYCTGFIFEYIPVPEFEGFDGAFIFERETSTVKIFYSTKCCAERQRFTKVHELFHFLQSIDPKIVDYLDRIMAETFLPNDIIIKLIEKSADKATAMYLMPNNYFVGKYQITKDVVEIAEYFGVSAQTAEYRLKECGLISY